MPRGWKGGISASLGIVFALLSAFHIVGAFGVSDDLPVVPVVSERPTPMPSSLSWLAVAAALAVAPLVVLARGDLILTSTPPTMSTFACSVLGLVFVLRAVGEFRMFGFFRSITGTDFAFWDAWLYTPLCLALGLGALWLATTRRAR